jgi:hypothetical protein
MPSGASAAACTTRPLCERTGPARAATIRHAYPPACWNTSCGPARSSDWNPSKITNVTRRMCLRLPPPHHVVNDAHPTIHAADGRSGDGVGSLGR